MAKLDPTVIYGTLSINGELTTRKNTVSSKGSWFKTDLDTAGYVSFTTNASSGYKIDNNIQVIKDKYIEFAANTTWSGVLRVGGNGHTSTANASIVTTDGNLHLDAKAGKSLYLNNYAGSEVRFGNGSGSIVAIMTSAGDMYKGTSTSGNKYWHAGNDGSGSGLSADDVDGHQGSVLIRNNTTGAQRIQGTLLVGNHSSASSITLGLGDSDTGFKWISDGHAQMYANNVNIGQWTSAGMDWTKTPKVNGVALLTATGKAADSDKLDGISSGSFVRSDANDTVTGDLTLGGVLIRNGHSKGYFCGSYNSVAANHGMTNPIYTIGTSYKPSDTTLGDMYGIGYTSSGSATFLTTPKAAGVSGWGMYICSGGNANIFLDAQHGHMWASGTLYESGATLSSRYLGKTAKAADSNLLDGIDSGGFIRSNAADTFTGTLTANHGSGTNVLAWTGGGLRKITNQHGIGLSCDSSMVLFAGDDINRILSGRGIVAGTSTEEMVVSADGTIVFLPNQQAGYNAGHLVTMSSGSLNATHNVVAGGNVSGYSDARIKAKIEKIANPLEKIDQINGYTFERKDLEYKRDTGVLAQEIEKVLPEVITTVDVDDNDFIEDGKLKTVDYGKISGLLIECIKELKKEINELKGRA